MVCLFGTTSHRMKHLCRLFYSDLFATIHIQSYADENTMVQPTLEFEDRVGVLSVYVYLFHDLKGDAIIQLAEAFNLAVASRVLRSKLVTRKTNHHQSHVFVFLVQRLKTCELRCESAFACCVHYQ